MAPTFVFKLGGLDLSTYLRVNPDDHMDPEGAPWVQPAWADTPFSDGQVLISTTVQNREQTWPLYLVDATHGKDQLHALIQSIQNATAVRPLLLEWRDSNATFSTFFDVSFVRFEPDFNFRRGGHGYAAGVLRVFTTGYGHTGTTRVTATAAGTGIFLSVPIASVAGDAPALLDTTVSAGAVLPSLGRIIAVAPIGNPSYAALVPAPSLTDAQTGATLRGASGAQGSQYLAMPVSPTGGASGIACTVPLPNPTIAGGDNRIFAVVQSGIDAGIGLYALDPYNNVMGATAIASNTAGWGLVDLGVCRLPTVGLPTLPKIAIYGGGVWASGQAGPLVIASPALLVNEIFVLPDKNLTVIYERGAGAALSRDGFTKSQQLNGTNDNYGNTWSEGWNSIGGTPNLLTDVGGWLYQGIGIGSGVDSSHIANVLTDTMAISAKALFFTCPSGCDVRLLKETASGDYLQGRIAQKPGGHSIDIAAATNVTLNTLGSLAVATLTLGQKYRMLLQCQGAGAFLSVTRDDGGPMFIPGSAAYASVGVSSDPAVAGGGVPGISIAHFGTSGNAPMTSWEVDPLPVPNAVTALLPYDNYRIDGPDSDSYRMSSAGVFANQKLVSVQRGAFPKMSPSTTSVAVISAPVDQGIANDVISAVVSVRERYTYGR